MRNLARTMTAPRCAFTLLELMIVVIIMIFLAGMLMPMLNMIQRQTMRSRTQFILKKVDTCLRLFKDEYGVYPYQSTYPDPVDAKTYPNRLNYQIGTDISITGSPSDRDNVKTDINAVRAKFNYAMDVWGNESGTQPAPLVLYRQVDIKYNGSAAGTISWPLLANRMAMEQQRLAVLAGDIDTRGPYICDLVTLVPVIDKRATRILPTPASAAKPGWAVNYLKGEIDRKYIRGDAILDAWKTPLIYICQAIPGERGTYISLRNWNEGWLSQPQGKCLGLGPIGFDTTTGPAASLISANRSQLLYGGRVGLSRTDAGDGQATPMDATYFPTPSDLLDSDVRYYATPGFETEFELWSAGPDRSFSYMRNNRVNTDNIAVMNYNSLLRNE